MQRFFFQIRAKRTRAKTVFQKLRNCCCCGWPFRPSCDSIWTSTDRVHSCGSSRKLNRCLGSIGVLRRCCGRHKYLCSATKHWSCGIKHECRLGCFHGWCWCRFMVHVPQTLAYGVPLPGLETRMSLPASWPVGLLKL